MTDRELAIALQRATEIERSARAHWEACRAAQRMAEADAALVALRLATPLRRSLETWVTDRACRAALQQPAETP